ncbi:zinc finger CCCH domain-containing protein 42, partial [Phtheirospermum japonicum]
DLAYVYVGGIPFDLTEGSPCHLYSRYGEIVDVNLVIDKCTGKSKGFAFVAYEDQRSTNLAVDNLNGAQILGRTIRVDHVGKYKKLEEEDEETRKKKRKERGICRAFQKGECNPLFVCLVCVFSSKSILLIFFYVVCSKSVLIRMKSKD